MSPPVHLCPLPPHIGTRYGGRHAADPARRHARPAGGFLPRPRLVVDLHRPHSRAMCWRISACTTSPCATRPRSSCCSPAMAAVWRTAWSMNRQGYLYAAADVMRRAWTLYIAHIFLFVIYTAQVAYSARRWTAPTTCDETRLDVLANAPYRGDAAGAAAAVPAQPAEHPAAVRDAAADLRRGVTAAAPAGAAAGRVVHAIRRDAGDRAELPDLDAARSGISIRLPGSSCS